MKILRSITAALALTGFLMAWALAAHAAPAQDRAIRVAVANVPRIFIELQETKDLDERFKADRTKLGQEEVPMVAKLKEMEAEGRNYRPSSQQYEDWRQRFVKARVDYKAWGEVAKAEMDWKRKRQTRELYDKIYAAVSEYATSNQIDLVLADHQPTMTDKELEQIQGDNLPSILNQRRVIYASKNADISDAIIASLDAKYKAGGGAGSVGITGGTQGADAAKTAGANVRGNENQGGQASPQRRPPNR